MPPILSSSLPLWTTDDTGIASDLQHVTVHTIGPHHRAAPPGRTTGPHHRAAPPGRTTGPHHRAAPPGRTTGPHHRAAPPGRTTGPHHRAAPPGHTTGHSVANVTMLIKSETNIQGRIYYEANEASASGPHHLGGPDQNFNAVSKVDFFIA